MEEKNKNRLKEILKEIGFTEKAFADEIGSTEDMISQCANGHKQLPIKLAMKIHEKFNYSLDYIYSIECNGMIDFRELLKFEDNKIHIYIPRKYVEYIIESKKYRDLSEVGKILDNNDIECKISIKKEDLFQCIRNGDYDIPYCDNYFGPVKHEPITREEKELQNYNLEVLLDEGNTTNQVMNKLFNLITDNIALLNLGDINKIYQFANDIIEKRKD